MNGSHKWYMVRSPSWASTIGNVLSLDRGCCDTEVARMIARYTGASLGLLAFAIATISGLLVQNPVSVTLSRGIFALFVFCIVGMALGHAAQMVITEHESVQRSEIEKRYGEKDVDTEVDGAETESSAGERDAVSA